MQDLGRRRSSTPAYATRSGSRAGRSNHTPTWPQPSPRLSGAASTAKPSTRRNRRYLRSDNRHRLLAVLSTAGAAGRLTSNSGQHGHWSAFADSQDRTTIHCCDLCSDRSGARACRGVPRSTHTAEGATRTSNVGQTITATMSLHSVSLTSALCLKRRLAPACLLSRTLRR